MSSVPEIRQYPTQSETEMYRPISSLAVVSFVFSLTSVFAFAATYYFAAIFWLLPVVTFCVAAWAALWLESAKREYAGQTLARLALLISLICGLAAPVRYWLTVSILQYEATQTASQFVDLLLENRIKEGFLWYVLPNFRKQGREDLSGLLKLSGENYRRYLLNDSNQVLAGMGAQAQVTILPTNPPEFVKGRWETIVHYQIDLDLPNNPKLNGTWIYLVQVVGSTAPNKEWSGRSWWIEETRAVPLDIYEASQANRYKDQED